MYRYVGSNCIETLLMSLFTDSPAGNISKLVLQDNKLQPQQKYSNTSSQYNI